MTLEDIWQDCANLRVKEKRELSEDFAELVFYTEDADQWITVLAAFLGQPAKPAGVAPTPEQQKVADSLGGIYRQQTLFVKDIDHSSIIAMLWPWGDGTHTTLKMFLVSKSST